jgi:SAM-dependent methyltransferase
MRFLLEPFNPFPVSEEGIFDNPASASKELMAINIEAKYQFVDEEGKVYHEYFFPNDRGIHNLGGYVGKVVMYRDPALRRYLQAHGVSKESFRTLAFPVLATRSPQLDLLLLDLIRHLRSQVSCQRVSLFDHGCSVAEHFDLLDAMLQATSDGRETAASVLSYYGLDTSAMLLAVARLLHPKAEPEHFRLVQEEGSQFTFSPGEFDLSLSVGVVNHVYDALAGLEKILRATRHASVLALWVTAEPEGFWAINHSGVSSYFFSRKDLKRVESVHPGGRFLVADFIAEKDSTQQASYIGIGRRKTESMGCYHLVYTTLPDPPFALPTLEG